MLRWVLLFACACRYGFDERDARPDEVTPLRDASHDGIVTTTNDVMIDTPIGCPGACTSCKPDGTCLIDCSNGCASGATCPAGRACEVTCIGSTACEFNRIDCSAATSCVLTCTGTDACDRGVICGGTACTVICDGSAACEDGAVVCNAGTCAITCSGSAACNTGVCCNGASCGVNCTALDGGNCAPPATGC